MKTTHRALKVWRIRRWTGRVALLGLASAMLWMALSFGRMCGQEVAPHGPASQVVDLAGCLAAN